MSELTDLLTFPNEYFDSQKTPGFVQGKVIENNNKDHPGMVKVEFTAWEEKKNICEWVRLLSPYTGGNYGSYLVPEINEEVLVGFIGGSLKRPFLLGSLYPQNCELIKNDFDDKNLKKHFKTKGGMEIEILDTADKGYIKIMTKKEQQILIDDEKESCSIGDKEGKNQILMDFKGGEITIKAENKISLSAGNVIAELDGKGKSLNQKADKIGIKAANSMELEGSSKAVLKGGMLQLSGSQSLKAEGGTTTEIKGAMVKIN